MDYFYIFIGGSTISIGLWNLIIAILGLFPKCLSAAVGTLNNTNRQNSAAAVLPVLFIIMIDKWPFHQL